MDAVTVKIIQKFPRADPKYPSVGRAFSAVACSQRESLPGWQVDCHKVDIHLSLIDPKRTFAPTAIRVPS